MCVSGPETAVPAFLITAFLTSLVTSFGLPSNHLLPFPTGMKLWVFIRYETPKRKRATLWRQGRMFWTPTAKSLWRSQHQTAESSRLKQSRIRRKTGCCVEQEVSTSARIFQRIKQKTAHTKLKVTCGNTLVLFHQAVQNIKNYLIHNQVKQREAANI